MIQKMNTLFLLTVSMILAGCAKFSAIAIVGNITQGASSTQPGQRATEALDCGDARLMAGFSQTFWQFTKSKCVACHGPGVSGRAFASSNLSEAYDAFRSPSTGGFKETRLIANALNPLHGSPTSNGEMNRATVEQAANDWAKLAAEICASKPTPTPSPTPAPTPAPGSTPNVNATPTPAPTPTATPVPSTGDIARTSVSIINQFNMLTTYQALVGTHVSDNTKNKIYNNPRYMVGIRGSRRYLMPASSKPAGYTSGTLMVSLIAATEHCRDMVDKEKNLSSSQRRFFVNYDFSKSDLGSLTSSQVSDAGKALAKGFWFRDPVSEESAAFQGLATELKTQSVNPSQAAILLCTMALTSISSNVR
jgi:hypothetical protein